MNDALSTCLVEHYGFCVAGVLCRLCWTLHDHLRRVTFVQCVVYAQTLRKLWASKSGLSIPNQASTSPALRNDGMGGVVQYIWQTGVCASFSRVFKRMPWLSRACATHVLFPSPTAGGSHAFMWRDLFDIAVRWRQIADPYDPVYVE